MKKLTLIPPGSRRLGGEILTLLLLTLASSPLVGAVSKAGDLVEVYQSDPIELHRLLRSRFTAGQDTGPAVREFATTTGDYSFDGLQSPTAARIQAMRGQREAFKAWESGRYSAAVSLYSAAARDLHRLGMASEAAFCLYYVAEIFAEQDRFAASLIWIEKARRMSAGSPAAYLEGLLHQSQGYSFWYLDCLRDSTHAFSQSLLAWQSIEYPAGRIIAWNNLGALYEELKLPETARFSYLEAWELLSAEVPEELAFQVCGNLARFLFRLGDREGAWNMLQQARIRQGNSSQAFALLQVELESEGVQRLSHQPPDQPAERIEQLLLLARLAGRVGPRRLVGPILETAERISRQADLRFYTRRTTIALGRTLESEGRFKEALSLYTRLLDPESDRTGLLIPYSFKNSALLDGRIRCLIRLGRHGEARAVIREEDRIRLAASARLDELKRTPLTGSGLQLLGSSAALETGLPGTGRLPVPAAAARPGWAVPGAARVELWPDETEVFAWVDSAAGTRFVRLRTSVPIPSLVEGLVGRFYQPETVVPPEPPPGWLERFSEEVFYPLESLFASNRVQIIAHKELQWLPFELLPAPAGGRILERYSISYLPSGLLEKDDVTVEAPGLILLSGSADQTPEAGRETTFFNRWLPGTRIATGLDQEEIRAPFVHVSAHFRLNPHFWIGSRFQRGGQAISLTEFLSRRWSCRLVSLGVCDAANPRLGSGPFRLGLVEMLLARGVGSVLASRWPLDELSVDIYLDFYRYCLQGMAMDEAAAQARRNFLDRTLERSGQQMPSAHPFFWAGISYFGPPGRKLFDASE